MSSTVPSIHVNSIDSSNRSTSDSVQAVPSSVLNTSAPIASTGATSHSVAHPPPLMFRGNSISPYTHPSLLPSELSQPPLSMSASSAIGSQHSLGPTLSESSPLQKMPPFITAPSLMGFSTQSVLPFINSGFNGAPSSELNKADVDNPANVPSVNYHQYSTDLFGLGNMSNSFSGLTPTSNFNFQRALGSNLDPTSHASLASTHHFIPHSVISGPFSSFNQSGLLMVVPSGTNHQSSHLQTIQAHNQASQVPMFRSSTALAASDSAGTTSTTSSESTPTTAQTQSSANVAVGFVDHNQRVVSAPSMTASSSTFQGLPYQGLPVNALMTTGTDFMSSVHLNNHLAFHNSNLASLGYPLTSRISIPQFSFNTPPVSVEQANIQVPVETHPVKVEENGSYGDFYDDNSHVGAGSKRPRPKNVPFSSSGSSSIDSSVASFGPTYQTFSPSSYTTYPDSSLPVQAKDGSVVYRHKVGRRTISSQYRGVSMTQGGYWRVQIGFQGKRVSVGHFSSEIEAARAYDRTAKELQGASATLNFPNLNLTSRDCTEETNNAVNSAISAAKLMVESERRAAMLMKNDKSSSGKAKKPDFELGDSNISKNQKSSPTSKDSEGEVAAPPVEARPRGRPRGKRVADFVRYEDVPIIDPKEEEARFKAEIQALIEEEKNGNGIRTSRREKKQKQQDEMYESF